MWHAMKSGNQGDEHGENCDALSSIPILKSKINRQLRGAYRKTPWQSACLGVFSSINGE
jgi:hypothetical protein